MSKTLFINARLIDPVALTDSTGSLLVENGMISTVSEENQELAGPNIIDCKGKCLAPRQAAPLPQVA